MRLTILYDNMSIRTDAQEDWGFACAIELPGTRMLFDTGADPQVLLGNMQTLGFGPDGFDFVVISHDHWDHTGGLDAVLEANSNAVVVVPSGVSGELRDRVLSHGVTLKDVTVGTQIAPGAFSTGVVHGGVAEHAVAVRVESGMVVVTGCAHPGVAGMVAAARTMLADGVELLLGGFHLESFDGPGVAEVIRDLHRLGVAHVAPCHCTGAEAIQLFAEAWGTSFARVGVGWSKTWRDASD
ncbi:MAG TPA: MBL fold metallo-hydrolase [Armatimonadetes bacterium]|jgi:7,8-dihydropterin-6-yl-methyl-4-(beta-D-ribofuranosyl)aminobenzene 5'-phosphate synthase|nr:MBL fold metallo-hydrolase [Armatimonadota bacterium]